MTASRMKSRLAALAFVTAMPSAALAQQAEMTFFVSSAGSGKGADLGGLDGADQLCQRLAQAVGSSGKTWRAYLSTQAVGATAAVNARDRIGRGPWQNAKGVVIAKDVAELHSPANNLTKQTALTERGAPVNGRGDTPNTTTSSPDRSPTARRSPPARIELAATTPRAGRKGRSWSAITTAWA